MNLSAEMLAGHGMRGLVKKSQSAKQQPELHKVHRAFVGEGVILHAYPARFRSTRSMKMNAIRVNKTSVKNMNHGV